MSLSFKRDEREAKEYIARAEAALNRTSLYAHEAKMEDAIMSFKKAANLYIIVRNWQSAGETFVLAAESETKLKLIHQAAMTYLDAVACFKLSNQDDAVLYTNEAITLFLEVGHFRMAAKLEDELGEIYQENKEIEEAVEHYQKAAGFFKKANLFDASINSLLKVAKFASELKIYDEPIKIFEDTANYCSIHNLLKFNAKDYFLNAVLCQLASFVEYEEPLLSIISDRLYDYKRIDYTFPELKQGRFCEDIILATDKLDIDLYVDCVYDYDNVTKLDAWQLLMLTRVRDYIRGRKEENDTKNAKRALFILKKEKEDDRKRAEAKAKLKKKMLGKVKTESL